MEPATYIHGTRPEEQQRLAGMNALLNAEAISELGLRGGERVLDVGCGLAQLTQRISEAVGPTGLVIGVECDPAQLREAEHLLQTGNYVSKPELRKGDALALPLIDSEWGTFDLVHARFILEHLTEPAGAVRQMVKAARPGARVVLADDDHDVLRIEPAIPGFDGLWEAYIETYRRLGCDPFVGRRLVSLLAGAGARPRKNKHLFLGSCAGNESFHPMVRNMIGVIASARDRIAALGRIAEPEIDETFEAIRDWACRPDAALWYSLC